MTGATRVGAAPATPRKADIAECVSVGDGCGDGDGDGDGDGECDGEGRRNEAREDSFPPNADRNERKR